ncbi:MAG: HD domain-containing protein, partial [Bacteroidota bacterium]
MELKEAVQGRIFHNIQACAESLGLRAFVIGGFVRDSLLPWRNQHGKDIDIVVEGRGIELAQAFGKRMRARQVHIFKNYGTAMVQVGEVSVEFVGARKESYNRNSRKPIVEEGTLEEDQLRRDFTINALSISLNKDSFGQLHDPFSGMDDLESGIIRTPTDPSITFSDDPLRMMRAIRFATQLGFFIEPGTFEGIVQNRERIEIVSKERIADELNKIILADRPSVGFHLIEQTGLLSILFPELENMKGIDYVNGRGHKDNFLHTLKVLDNVAEKSDNLWLRWVAILHDIAKPLTKRYEKQHGWTFHGHEDRGARMVPKIFRRMKLPLNEHMKYVQKLVKLHQRPIALVNAKVT